MEYGLFLIYRSRKDERGIERQSNLNSERKDVRNTSKHFIRRTYYFAGNLVMIANNINYNVFNF